MLTDTSITNVIIKFITGEEVVCQKIFQDGNTIKIKNTLSFVMAFNPEYPTQGEVSFSPWLVGSDFNTEHVINVHSIITMTTPSSTINEKYSTALNTIAQNRNPPAVPNLNGASGNKPIARR